MDTASEFQDPTHYLPKEPMDLPLPEKEIPSHAAHGHTETYTHPSESIQTPPSEQYFVEPDDTLYQVKTLLSWTAPGRPFRAHGKEWFASIILITFLIEIIIFLFGEYLLMVVVLSLVFVTFALAVVPPHDYHYRISTEGVTIEDHFYLWQELYDFYFKRRDNQDILHIRTKTLLPGELTFTLGDIHKEQVKTILIPFLPYRELVHLTYMEKAGNWISNTFPLERIQK